MESEKIVSRNHNPGHDVILAGLKTTHNFLHLTGASVKLLRLHCSNPLIFSKVLNHLADEVAVHGCPCAATEPSLPKCRFQSRMSTEHVIS